MKSLLRYFLINIVSLIATAEVLKGGLVYEGGVKTLVIAGVIFAAINFLLVPLLKILLLPLNLLTLGLFAWMSNVLAVFVLTNIVPKFKLVPYHFTGFAYQGFIVPSIDLSIFAVAVIASFLIGGITHFLHWLMH